MEDWIKEAVDGYSKTLDERAFRARHINLENFFAHLILKIEEDIAQINEQEVWRSQGPIEWNAADGGGLVAAKSSFPAVYLYISESVTGGVDVTRVTKDSTKAKEYRDAYHYPATEDGRHVVLVDDYETHIAHPVPHEASRMVLKPIIDAILKSLENGR